MEETSLLRRKLLSLSFKAGTLSLGFAVPFFSNAAQNEWPKGKPIKLIIPAQPGGGLDLIARLISERLTDTMGVGWVAENLGGGGGTIASVATARAVPDGQTFMIVNISTHGTNPAVRELPYNPIKDFTHVGMIGGSPNALVVGPNLPKVNSLETLVTELKKLGRPPSYGSAGPGTSSHLIMEQFSLAIGLPMIHIPYRGIGPSMIDLIAGRTDFAFPGLIAVWQFIKTEKLRAIGVTSPTRLTLLPNVETFTEFGMPEFSSLQWYGLSGPANLPKEIVSKLNNQLTNILKDPKVINKLESETLTLMPMSSQEFTNYVSNDINKWKKLVKDRGIKIDNT